MFRMKKEAVSWARSASSAKGKPQAEPNSLSSHTERVMALMDPCLSKRWVKFRSGLGRNDFGKTVPLSADVVPARLVKQNPAAKQSSTQLFYPSTIAGPVLEDMLRTTPVSLMEQVLSRSAKLKEVNLN